MKSTLRGIGLAGAGILVGAGSLWAHPGHVAGGGIRHTITHAVASPYHVAVICAVVILAVGWALALRPVRAQRRHQRQVNGVL